MLYSLHDDARKEPYNATMKPFQGILVIVLLVLSACGHPRVSQELPVPRHPLTRWHKAFRGSTPWRLTEAGVERKGRGLERTPGRPKTVTWIWETYHLSIDRWSVYYQVPAELIVATIAIEATPLRGQPGYTRDPACARRERGFVSVQRTPHLISVGLMQTTVATARTVLEPEGIPPSSVDERWLALPDNAIRAGVSYIAAQAEGRYCNIATMLDPPVVFASYQAGGLYRMRGRDNEWKMRQYPYRSGRHVDRGVQFFNDAVYALRSHPQRPTYGYRTYLTTLPRWPES